MARKPPSSQPFGDGPPRYVRQRQRSDGTWRVWWEPPAAAKLLGWANTDLPDDPGKARREADRLNAQLDRGTRASADPRPVGRTMTDLMENYRGAPQWRALAPKTRESYARLMAIIGKKWGGELVAAFTPAVVNAWYESYCNAGRPRMAQALVRMLSTLFTRASLIGWRPAGSNPCRDVRMATPAPRTRRATWSDLDALVAKADALGLHGIGTAVLLLALAGQRSTDVREARLSDFRLVTLVRGEAPAWCWALTRQKRGTPGLVELHPDLERRLRPRLLRPAEDADSPACPRPDTGGPYNEDLFIRHFAKVRDATGRKALAGLQMRDLRRTFAVLARDGGASPEDVGDALGNTAGLNPVLKATYMPATAIPARRAVRSIQRPKGDEG